MNLKLNSHIAAAALLLSLLLASCAFNRDALIGTWSTPSGIVVTFTDDGRLRQVPPQGLGPVTETGYQFLNDNTIILTNSQTRLTFKVEGDKLTLDPGGGQQLIDLTRSK